MNFGHDRISLISISKEDITILYLFQIFIYFYSNYSAILRLLLILEDYRKEK